MSSRRNFFGGVKSLVKPWRGVSTGTAVHTLGEM